MTGSFLQGTQIQITDAIANLISLQNVGIAAVTPADKLYKVLFSEEMVRLRQEQEKNLPPSEAQPRNPAEMD